MFGSSIDRMVTAFSGQFENEDGQLVYRKGGRGSPIPVTAAERDDFIDAYRRGVRQAFWIFMAALFVGVFGMVGVLVYEDVSYDDSSSDIILYAALITMTVIFVWHTMRLYRAPAQQLHRLPIGPERSRAEMRQKMLGEMTYARLAGAAAFGAYFGWRATTEQSFERYFSIALCITLLGVSALQAVRKLMQDRRDPTP
jgi:hypothetical protein